MKSRKNSSGPKVKIKHISCLNCGILTNPSYLVDGCCTVRCSLAHQKITVICQGCGEDFTPKVRSATCCSRKCAQVLNKERGKKYREKHKDNSSFHIFKRDNFQCVYCGASAHDGTKLHVDHIYPLHLGGTNELFNLITACSVCNTQKNCSRLSDEKIIELWSRNKHLEGLTQECDYHDLKGKFDAKYKKGLRNEVQ